MKTLSEQLEEANDRVWRNVYGQIRSYVSTWEWVERIVVRITSSGQFLRMHPAGFCVRFPSGPYMTFDDAVCAPINYSDAKKYEGYAVHEDVGSGLFSYYRADDQ